MGAYAARAIVAHSRKSIPPYQYRTTQPVSLQEMKLLVWTFVSSCLPMSQSSLATRLSCWASSMPKDSSLQTTKFSSGVQKVVLYHINGSWYEVNAANIAGEEYVKVVLREGRMVGAILIGETDLEVGVAVLLRDQLMCSYPHYRRRLKISF